MSEIVIDHANNLPSVATLLKPVSRTMGRIDKQSRSRVLRPLA